MRSLAFATNPYQFDFGRYLLSQGCESIIFSNDIEVISKTNNIFYKTRNYIRDKIIKEFGNNNYLSSLILSVIIGDRSLLDNDLKEDFYKSGIAHFLAISGLHVGIIYFIIIVILRSLFIPKRIAYLISILFLFFFLFISGFSTSVIRAVILIILYVLSVIFQRDRNPFQILGIAGLIILINEPLNLWNNGFLFSFIAVFSLIVFLPKINKYLEIKIKNLILKYFILTFFSVVIINLCLLPLLSNSYSQISLLGVFSNIILIPILNLFIFSIILFLIIGGSKMVFISGSVWIFGEIILKVSKFISSLQFNIIKFAAFSVLLTVSFYLVLLFLRISLEKRKFFKYFLVSLMIFFVVFFYSINKTENPYIMIFDIGQGDASLVHTHKHNILIDGGRGYGTGKNIISPYLLKSGINKIDLIIATHPDADHIGGLYEIVKRIRVERVAVNGIERDTEIYSKLSSVIEENKIVLEKNDIIIGDIFNVIIISPDNEKLQSAQNGINQNIASIYSIFNFYNDSISIIFPGDANLFFDSSIVTFKKNILHSAHHGDLKTNPFNIIKLLNPEYVLFSSGIENNYGHPNIELIKFLKDNHFNYLRTDLNGAIKISLPDFEIKCYNPDYLWNKYDIDIKLF